MKNLTEKLIQNKDLTSDEATELMTKIMDGELSPAVIAAVLVALRMKGETTEEITAFAKVMRSKATPIPVKGDTIVDTCGTGGDASHSFNISTTVALLLSGGGYKVAKHGNRSMTSKSGSADVLESLGVNLNLTPDQVAACVDQTGIGFLFAPALHSAMKNVMPVRKELGVRTIFNILGPLTNPAGANVQILGLFDASLVGTLAHVLRDLGLARGFVVSGKSGFDEVAIHENSLIAHIRGDGKIEEFEFDPEIFGYEKVALEELRGGEASDNATITKDILSGNLKGPKRDVIALNAGFAIAALDEIDLKAAFHKAEDLLTSGAGLKALESLVEVSNSFNG
ncbi:MAG: anthranilate phosphoribosyltransferase [SAR324 cluster bacterium]|nr:anthranilate phosphoribosyltransferase [SAR324 cluster bacterium]